MNKKLLAVAISSALAAPMSAQAIEAAFSGHVNRAIMFVDDGVASDVQHVDNGASRTRLRFVGSGDLGVGGINVGTYIEYSVASNLSSNVTIKSRGGNTGAQDLAFDIRHSRLWFSGGWGKVTLGHGSGAYDGVMYKDYGGSVALAGIEYGTNTFAGSIAMRTPGGGLAGTTVAGAFGAFDGGRYDNVRYDTPKLGPLSAAVDFGDNQRWSAKLQVNTSFSGAKFQAAVGYEDRDNDAGREQYGGSASVLFSQGTNITIAYAERDPTAGASAENWYVKLGHKWGQNAVAIDYSETDDLPAGGAESTTWGVAFSHDIPDPNVQLYTGYRNFDLDLPGVAVEDVDSFNIGARVRF